MNEPDLWLFMRAHDLRALRHDEYFREAIRHSESGQPCFFVHVVGVADTHEWLIEHGYTWVSHFPVRSYALTPPYVLTGSVWVFDDHIAAVHFKLRFC